MILIGTDTPGQLGGSLTFTQSNGTELITSLFAERGSRFDYKFSGQGVQLLRPGNAALPVELILNPDRPNAAEIVVNEGNVIVIKAVVFDENGEIRDDISIQYLSLDEQAAEVEASGQISGNEAGFSTLTTLVGDVIRTITVTVVRVTQGPPGISISGIAEDLSGTLFLASPLSQTILQPPTLQDIPTVYAGVSRQPGFRNDTKLAALFDSPRSLGLRMGCSGF